MAHSYEIRKAVLEADRQGMSSVDIKVIFGIGKPVLDSWKRLLKETGDLKRRPPSPGAPPNIKTEDFIEYMKCSVNQEKTQEEIGLEWNESKMTISNMMKKIGFTRKKNVHL